MFDQNKIRLAKIRALLRYLHQAELPDNMPVMIFIDSESMEDTIISMKDTIEFRIQMCFSENVAQNLKQRYLLLGFIIAELKAIDAPLTVANLLLTLSEECEVLLAEQVVAFNQKPAINFLRISTEVLMEKLNDWENPEEIVDHMKSELKMIGLSFGMTRASLFASGLQVLAT